MINPADISLIHSNVDFTRLHGKRVLITGGTGFVGRWMSLVPDGVNITALSHEQYDNGDWYRQSWDYIIHLAMTGADRVIECAACCGAPILFSSSGSVVVDKPPYSEYNLTKKAAEAALLASGLNVKIARMYTFAGPWMKNRYALINMIHDGIYGDYIRVRSSVVSVTRSYMYAADMAIWLWCILLDGEPGGVYEVGATKPVTMWQLAREVQECITPRMMIYHEPMMTREPRPYYVPTTAIETMALLGLEEYTPFSEAIAKTVRWYQEEGRELG